MDSTENKQASQIEQNNQKPGDEGMILFLPPPVIAVVSRYKCIATATLDLRTKREKIAHRVRDAHGES